MGAMNDRATAGRPSDRRNRRSACLADALRFQLDACRADEGLAAIVVADEMGFCVAHSGGDGSHEELAAQLPVLADPARRRLREEDDPDALQPTPPSLVVTTFMIPGATLHACTVAAPQAEGHEGHARGVAVLARVASGFSRLLAQ
ncbi:MAG: hypothetical protein ABUL77_05450 [Bacteroidota bacterium]